MSGEAYNNVQSAPIDEANLEDLRRLVVALARDEGADALALALLRVIGTREDLDRCFESLDRDFASLREPLRVFNNWQSGDSPEAYFRRTVAEWEGRIQ